ncbi:major facilitator superfamily domain-containing protein [Podospora fimiseda]|uniref:Major facilitator superfamily domain-containing protein n=1 Tax=Podospora fimiseda TaxID=252190 RepID=A0AAN7BZN9_9PEZI|nr:major facilitator superfamily domain-containing protein [Podospora fimiseda]
MSSSPSSSLSPAQPLVESEPEPAWKPPVSRRRAKIIFGFILIVQFMLSVDMTSVAVALPSVAKSMQASRTAVFSMGTVFSLSATICQQPLAELSHVMGRKPAFLLVLVMFALGSIIAGTAKSMTVVLVGRGIQGMSSSASVLAAMVLSDMIEVKDRATWISYQNAAQALGLVFGPLMAGALIKSVGWRSIFFINLPSIGISALGLWYFLGFDKPKGKMLDNLKRVDWVGIVIFTPSSVAFLAPFTMAGVLFKWKSWKALVPLFGGLAGLLLLAAHQRFWAKNPMFRAVVFEKPVVVCSLFGLTVFGVCVNMIFYYLVVFWSGVRGFDEILTGIALLPETLTIPISAILCGFWMRRTNEIRSSMRVGWPLTVLFLGLLWFQDEKTHLGVLIPINIGVGFGAGVISSAMNVTILAATAKKINGHVTAMAYLFKSAGMCLGIAVGTAIFTLQMTERFKAIGGDEMDSESMLRMLKDVKSNPESRGAIVSSLRVLWMVCCGLAGISGVLCNLWKYPLIDKNKAAAGVGNADVQNQAEQGITVQENASTSTDSGCYDSSPISGQASIVDIPQQKGTEVVVVGERQSEP